VWVLEYFEINEMNFAFGLFSIGEWLLIPDYRPWVDLWALGSFFGHSDCYGNIVIVSVIDIYYIYIYILSNTFQKNIADYCNRKLGIYEVLGWADFLQVVQTWMKHYENQQNAAPTPMQQRAVVLTSFRAPVLRTISAIHQQCNSGWTGKEKQRNIKRFVIDALTRKTPNFTIGLSTKQIGCMKEW
jgi:hypothetical protein